MSLNIKTGDLVMVVKPSRCCGNAVSIGKVFEVVSVGMGDQPITCTGCGIVEPAFVRVRFHDNLVCEPYRLIKIDPPALPESVETNQELVIKS